LVSQSDASPPIALTVTHCVDISKESHNVPHQRRAANISLQALYISRVRCMRLLYDRCLQELDITEILVIASFRESSTLHMKKVGYCGHTNWNPIQQH
jgi:hypothetical protein